VPCVAWADLTAPDVDDALARLAAQGTVAGVRETIRWHPDPAKRWTRAGILDDPAWRRGFSRLGCHGFLLEVLMNPYQAKEVARLAGDFPDQMIVVNHCGTPVDRDPGGLSRWRAGLAAMAARPNVALKISNYGNYATDHTPAALATVVMTCLDAFGATRALFGTDYPVARRNMSFGAICERLKDILEPLSEAEQRAVFFDSAARLYGFANATVS
jgi:predicted TIM-barrel fold metal-dependent hydrolase